MKRLTVAAASLFLLAPMAHAAGHASGDAAAGEDVYKKCRSCHMVESADGDTIQRGGRTGPNLWGIVGRQAGTYEGFRYSDVMVEAGEAGLVWTEEEFVKYVADPTPYLREYTGDSSARGKMTFKLGDATDAADVWAYLASVSPSPDM